MDFSDHPFEFEFTDLKLTSPSEANYPDLKMMGYLKVPLNLFKSQFENKNVSNTPINND